MFSLTLTLSRREKELRFSRHYVTELPLNVQVSSERLKLQKHSSFSLRERVRVRENNPLTTHNLIPMKSLKPLLPALAMAAATSCAIAPAQAQPPKPNVLFILVDDMGARDLSGYGSSLYETPNIDALATMGAKFTQAYVAYPRCVPSRYAILTGKHPARVMGNSDGVRVEPARDVSMGQAFTDGGYSTFYAGKWHLGEQPAGFTTTIAAGETGATASHFAPYNVAKDRRGNPKEKQGKGGDDDDKEGLIGLDDAPDGEYLTDRLTQETMNWIARHEKQTPDKPFFAVLAHYAVHTPIEGKADVTKRYARKLAGQPKPEQEFEKESAGENLLVQNNPTYAAMVQSVDEGVGRLMAQLKELKIDGETIVVLVSDHGGLSARGNTRQLATSNRPLRAGKGHLYDGGLRVPLEIVWPGHVKPGTINDTVVSSMDLFPTLLEMTGLPLQPKAHLDGRSFEPLFKDKVVAERPLFWHNPAPRPTQTADVFSSAIRAGDLKLMQFPDENRVELYDLSSDIGEGKDLSTERAADAKRLEAQLNAWKAEVGAASEPRVKKSKADKADKPMDKASRLQRKAEREAKQAAKAEGKTADDDKADKPMDKASRLQRKAEREAKQKAKAEQ